MITTLYNGNVLIESTDEQSFVQDILAVAKTGSFSTSDENALYAKRNWVGHYSVTLVPFEEQPVKKPHHFSAEGRAAKAKAQAEKGE